MPLSKTPKVTMISDLTNDDKCFLLYFILGTYFGPDIKGETPKKSLLQRVAEGLPPYTSHQLSNSLIKLVELERLYYYILRNADKSLTFNTTFLHRFFQGQPQNVYVNYPHFMDLFPPQLHPQSRFKSRFKVIHNVAFINDPERSYMKAEDVERFKRLSNVEDLHVDRDAVKFQLLACFDCSNSSNAGSDGVRLHTSSPRARGSGDDGGGNVRLNFVNVEDDESGPERVGPAVLFLPSRPTEKEWSEIVAASEGGFALTGSAAMGQVGPSIGLIDIGESEDSYMFRVCLPGVKRDEREFSCEVDTNGKVLIQGVTTTGEKTVSRCSQVFEMQTHNLCPPGQFSLKFQLPGPVDPHQFSGNFGTDGILEGIVMKGKVSN